MNDDLGDRMKIYEQAEAGRRFMPLLPIMARIDGRSFSKFTRNMERPYDKRLSLLMQQTAKYLASESNACMTYTQSDETSLTWHSTDIRSQVFFDGKIMKMTSQLASLATVCFNNLYDVFFGNKGGLATFDCRCWQVPNRTEGANTFLWREQDAAKNSVQSVAPSLYSHREVNAVSTLKMQDMIFQKGVNWNDYPAFFKRGVFIQKRTRSRKFSTEELGRLPEMHEARKNPDLIVERSFFEAVDMPIFSRVMNREAVIYEGAEPLTANDAERP